MLLTSLRPRAPRDTLQVHQGSTDVDHKVGEGLKQDNGHQEEGLRLQETGSTSRPSSTSSSCLDPPGQFVTGATHGKSGRARIGNEPVQSQTNKVNNKAGLFRQSACCLTF